MKEKGLSFFILFVALFTLVVKTAPAGQPPTKLIMTTDSLAQPTKRFADSKRKISSMNVSSESLKRKGAFNSAGSGRH
jgi:hypothetical protein